MKCPKHLVNNIRVIEDSETIFPEKFDEYFVGYKVVCNCGGEKFSLSKNTLPLVIGKCELCNEILIILDANRYPSFSVDPIASDLEDVLGPHKEKYYEVYIGFEYHELDDDEEFNQDDISWAYIYGYLSDTHEAFEILNVEA